MCVCVYVCKSLLCKCKVKSQKGPPAGRHEIIGRRPRPPHHRGAPLAGPGPCSLPAAGGPGLARPCGVEGGKVSLLAAQAGRSATRPLPASDPPESGSGQARPGPDRPQGPAISTLPCQCREVRGCGKGYGHVGRGRRRSGEVCHCCSTCEAVPQHPGGEPGYLPDQRVRQQLQPCLE